MLRINHVPDGDQLYDSVLHSLPFYTALLDFDVQLSPGLENPDYTFVGHRRFFLDPQAYLDQGPVILHGSYDMGYVPCFIRKWLEHPGVVRVIQGASYSSQEEHNSSWQLHYREGSLETATTAIEQPAQLSACAIDKVKVWAGFGVFVSNMPHFKTPPPLVHGSRAVKLHAVMTTSYLLEDITRHRQAAMAAVQRYMVQSGSSVVASCSHGDYRAMHLDAYRQTLGQCTAVLSPWGWGEFCVRDFEAARLGCVIIKPNTAFSQTWPELEPDVHYVACRPDFADLPEAVDTAVTRYLDLAWRQQLQTHVRQVENIPLLAQRFKDCLVGL